jgi:hypothetical protein
MLVLVVLISGAVIGIALYTLVTAVIELLGK